LLTQAAITFDKIRIQYRQHGRRNRFLRGRICRVVVRDIRKLLLRHPIYCCLTRNKYLFVAGYRVLLHPLRNYPGPFLAKITDGYAGSYAISKRLHLATFQDHHQYGPVMRHGPNRLVFNSAKALQGTIPSVTVAFVPSSY
jgi:hypothetical protein